MSKIQISASLDEEVYDKIKKLSDEHDRSTSWTINNCLKIFFETTKNY